jgi:hypothetical protein
MSGIIYYGKNSIYVQYYGRIMAVMLKNVNWTLKAKDKRMTRRNTENFETWKGNITLRNGEFLSGTWNAEEGLTKGTIVYDNDSEFQFYRGEIKNYKR